MMSRGEWSDQMLDRVGVSRSRTEKLAPISTTPRSRTALDVEQAKRERAEKLKNGWPVYWDQRDPGRGQPIHQLFNITFSRTP